MQANFISLKPPSSSSAPPSSDPSSSPQPLEQTLANAMSHLGPLLARSLVSNMGGNAARSELDKLCEPLKKLVTHHVGAHGWLERALLDEAAFPAAARVPPTERAVWLRKVVG